MNRTLPFALLTALVLPAFAFAQDQAIPYSDEPSRRTAAPQPATEVPPGTDLDPAAVREKSLSISDDPTTGLSAELRGGVLVLNSSRGQAGEPVFGYGARATWDFGRLFAEGWIHEGFFLDASWTSARFKDGTRAISTETFYQYLTLAPAFELPFGEGSPFGAYVQAGYGLCLQSATLRSDGAVSTTSGSRGAFQYGVGLRGRPLVNEEGTLRLTFRIEVMRFRRAYLDDTYAGATFGLGF